MEKRSDFLLIFLRRPRIPLRHRGPSTFQAVAGSKKTITRMLESRHFVLLVLTIGALTLLSGCNRIFGVSDRYLKDLPRRDELIGRWTIDDASIARMKSEQRFYPMSKL